jgi:catechol 2,3-dioxygenase-like lactoylglutathione lyase family enzyme
MSRVQLALNVGDVDEAVAFYSKLFGTGPAKRRPGYANFAIAEPPLKLVLIQSGLPGGTLNHLGVEVENTEEVSAATRRLASDGLDTDVEDSVSCCYAVQDKVWVSDPDGARWEVYTVLGDAPNLAPVSAATGEPEACNCCGAPAPAGETAASVQNSCC